MNVLIETIGCRDLLGVTKLRGCFQVHVYGLARKFPSVSNILPPSNEVAKIVSVRQSLNSLHMEGVPCDHYPGCIGPHHTGILLALPPPPLTWDLSVQGHLPPSSNLFIMKRVRLACGQFASYWNASLYLNFLQRFHTETMFAVFIWPNEITV